MQKKLTRIFALILTVILGAGLLSGCALFQLSSIYDVDDGYDDPDDYIEPDYDFTVACSLQETTITVSGVGFYGDEAQIVYLKPYQYLRGESGYGLAEDNITTTPVVVGQYACGTEDEYVIGRYDEDGYDTVYCKFYVKQGSNILAGPVYPTEIQSVYTHDEVVKTNGIKGIFCHDAHSPEVANLGCEHTEINFVVTGMIVPLEIVNEETGEIVPIEYEEHLDENGVGYIVGPWGGEQQVEAYDHNGKRYYFRTESWWGGYAGIRNYDNIISQYTKENVKVTLIVLLSLNREQYIQPYFITYKAARTDTKANYSAINTSNQYGAGYWAALMEFVAMRYSCEDSADDPQYGTVESYVMGNEIDYPDDWNSIIDPNLQSIDMEDYAAEYERMLRITNQSFKNAYARNVALISFTHNWGSAGYNRAYSPKEIFDYISAKTLSEGNYNWGIACHPYGSNLSTPDFWSNDVDSGITGSLNTAKITWTNLEVLQLYLEQKIKLCNGNVRDVFVTEGGVSSGDSEVGMFNTTKNQQAAGVAYAYYKCTQLSCIKALNYYHLADHPAESATNIYFGLQTVTGVNKPSYYLYKFIDTQYTWDVSAQYFSFIKWRRFENGSYVYYGDGMGGVREWSDTMTILPSLFDWDARWDESKIIVRQTDEIPSF